MKAGCQAGWIKHAKFPVCLFKLAEGGSCMKGEDEMLYLLCKNPQVTPIANVNAIAW